MAYDTAHGQVVLFGGGNENNTWGDTWVWDGTNWTQKFPQSSPPERSGAAMVYDSAHGQVVLFAGTGIGGNANYNDTWVWDGTNWTQLFPAISPPARQFHAMAYDSQHGQVVMFGGINQANNCFQDTWVWDGANWAEMSPSTVPAARAYDAMAYDSTRENVVLFGGGNSTGIFNDTWVWDGSNWTQEFVASPPSARYAHSMAYDSAHRQTVLFGGYGSQGNLGDTWLWNGSSWTEASPQASPSIRCRYPMAYDSDHDQVVLFGGMNQAINGISVYYGDTWTWFGGPLPVTISSVVNGASFVGGGVAPGEIATVFGVSLTSATGINPTSSLPLATTYLNDAVIVNSQPVALFAIDNVNGQQQINFQVPWEAASGPNASIAVSNNDTLSPSLSVPVVEAQPGIFNYAVGSDIFGAILHANFQLADTANPAMTGETVLIYCTGLGRVASPPQDGEPGKGQLTLATPTVMIGGTNALVSFSGLAPGFVGLYQVNAEIPTGLPAGNQPVVITVASAPSNSVLLPVQ